MHDMMKHCCRADGKPDLKKMAEFMQHHDRGSNLDAVGWALFFVWVGTAWLANVGLGVGLLGVALVTLGMQAVRRFSAVKVEGFWVVVGLAFAVGGIWEVLDVETPLAPIFIIAVGLGLLFWGMWPKSKRKHSREHPSGQAEHR